MTWDSNKRREINRPLYSHFKWKILLAVVHLGEFPFRSSSKRFSRSYERWDSPPNECVTLIGKLPVHFQTWVLETFSCIVLFPSKSTQCQKRTWVLATLRIICGLCYVSADCRGYLSFIHGVITDVHYRPWVCLGGSVRRLKGRKEKQVSTVSHCCILTISMQLTQT